MDCYKACKKYIVAGLMVGMIIIKFGMLRPIKHHLVCKQIPDARCQMSIWVLKGCYLL